MRNPGRWRLPRHSARTLYWLSVGYALVGVGWATFAILRSLDYAGFVLAGLWVLIGAGWFRAARRRRRREQRGHEQAWPVPAPEVRIMVEQGLKIRAIKRYRELNPGIGLKEAKDIIDRL